MLKNCQKCGTPVNAGMFKCPNCGDNLVYQQQQMSEDSNSGQTFNQQTYVQMPTQNVFGVSNNSSVDEGGTGWFILGFFIPLVGIILYFVWSGSNPGKAKKAGAGGLLGMGVNLILSFLLRSYLGL